MHRSPEVCLLLGRGGRRKGRLQLAMERCLRSVGAWGARCVSSFPVFLCCSGHPPSWVVRVLGGASGLLVWREEALLWWAALNSRRLAGAGLVGGCAMRGEPAAERPSRGARALRPGSGLILHVPPVSPSGVVHVLLSKSLKM